MLTIITFDKTVYAGPTTAEKILLGYRSFLSEGVTFKPEVKKWLDENCVDWKYKEERMDFHLIFLNESHAAHFKLVWGGI